MKSYVLNHLVLLTYKFMFSDEANVYNRSSIHTCEDVRVTSIDQRLYNAFYRSSIQGNKEVHS